MSRLITCVGNGWFPTMAGGLNRYVYELITHLGQLPEGTAVDFFGVGVSDSEIHSNLDLINLAEPNQPLWQRLWLTRQRFRHRYSSKSDAINLHFSLYSLPILLDLPRDVPVTFTFHGPWALESQREQANVLGVKAKHWFEQTVYHRCDRFIVLSQAFGTILHQEYGIDWDKIHVIPGGVDTNRFVPNLSRTQAQERLGWPSDRPILFTPRRLVHRMGLDKLLTAIAQIKSEIPDVWLAIAGKGVLRESLEQQSKELGLENQVKFLGFLPDDMLPIAYQAADLTVVPSQALEGFGLILLESLACGTPVMCTPVGGMPDVLNPLEPQLVTDGTEATAIATRLMSFLKAEIPLPSREICREYVMARFTWDEIAQRVCDVLLLDQPES